MEPSGCSAAEPFALRVLGDSMLPEFAEGHIIIIDPGMALHDGAYVVIDHAGETIFRQMLIEGDRRFLKPLNDAYDTVELTGDFHVHGVVVQRAGTRRKEHKHYY